MRPVTPPKLKIARFGHYLLAVALPACAIGLQMALSAWFGSPIFLLMFPAMYAVSWLAGLGPGLLATVISLLGVDFFLVEPYYQFGAAEPVMAFRLFLLAFVGVFITILNSKARQLRIKAESEKNDLEASEKRLRMVLRGGGAYLWEWHADSNKVWRSEGLDRLFGFEEGQGDGYRDYLKSVHQEDRKSIQDGLNAALAGLSDYNAEYRVVLPDETKWLHSKGIVERDSQNRVLGISGFTLDITERKRMELDLQAAKELAETSNRAKTQFVAHISHEFRTPLGVIMGFADLALEQASPASEQYDALVRIKNSSETLRALIGNVLDLAKVEANKLTLEKVRFDLRELLEEVKADVSLDVRAKNLDFKIEVSPDVPRKICSDPIRLRQIVLNLVGNALKFTEKGSIRVQVVSRRDQTTGINTVTLQVTDTGIGITEAQQSRLFQSFVQADNSTTRRYGGTGLGLVLSKELARLLGGDLWIETSQPGLGTTFSFSIDGGVLDLAPVISEVPKSPRLVSRELEGMHILVVDDSIDNRVLVSRFLMSAGATVMLAEDGQQGTDLAMSKQFDVVLMDIQMPVLDGHSATRLLRSKGYMAPVIALTAHAMTEEKDLALESGFTGFVTKPIYRNHLIQCVASMKPASRTNALPPEATV